MKKIVFCSFVSLILACQPQTTEREIGFHPNPDPDVAKTGWYLGTNVAIDVVVELDKVWKERDYEKMATFFADSVRITTSRGKRYYSAESFFAPMKAQENSTFSWELTAVYSVDISPNQGGEHVQARFRNQWKDSLGQEYTNFSHESYYVVDGKIVWLDQFAQRPIEESTN